MPACCINITQLLTHNINIFFSININLFIFLRNNFNFYNNIMSMME